MRSVFITQGSVTGGTTASLACCTSSGPDDSTIAAWAAKKAVARQLDWFNEKEAEKFDRAKVDEFQAKVDALCKWAKTLSNHIFSQAYVDWGVKATAKLDERRHYLDKLDVAESLITGLPTPPETNLTVPNLNVRGDTKK